MANKTSTSITLIDAVRLIAERVHRADETPADAENRVSHRVRYAVNGGKLSRLSNGHLFTDELQRWARKTWPNKFADLPEGKSLESHQLVQAKSFADAIIFPGTIERCHTLIAELSQKNADLEGQLSIAQDEIASLRPQAERWKALCARNRKSARARRGR